MPMSINTAAQIVEHVLGKAPPRQWPIGSIVTEAWQAFLDHHDWRWSAGKRNPLVLVADQATYALPRDMATILAISNPDNRLEPIRLVTWRYFEELRAYGYVGAQGAPPYHGAIRWALSRTDETWAPEIELWPIPGTAETFEVSYLPGSGAPQGNTDDWILGYPPYIGPAWTSWLRAYALGLIEHDVASLELRLAEVAAGHPMMAAIKRDAGSVRIRPASHGAASERPRLLRRRFYSGS